MLVTWLRPGAHNQRQTAHHQITTGQCQAITGRGYFTHSLSLYNYCTCINFQYALFVKRKEERYYNSWTYIYHFRFFFLHIHRNFWMSINHLTGNTGCPKKKAERRIFSTLRAKSVIYFYIIRYTSSPEENDTKIIKFGWVILILCPFLEIQSFSNFAWILRPTSEELWKKKLSIRCFVAAHWSVVLLLPRINGLPQNTLWKPCPDTFFFAHQSQKSSEIWKWLYFKKWA